MDWWNWYFPKENEAMARVQTQESWLSSISKMSQDDENMMSNWWYHHESSELFIHGEIESSTSAFAHMCMPFDIFVAKIAKDVREVLNGNKDSVKRDILANTDNSDSRGSHWVPVVYELIKQDLSSTHRCYQLLLLLQIAGVKGMTMKKLTTSKVFTAASLPLPLRERPPVLGSFHRTPDSTWVQFTTVVNFRRHRYST